MVKWLLGLVVALCVSTASAQDIFWSNSYSSPDYGYGYSTQTYGYAGPLGSPLTPYYSSSYRSPDYGWGRSTNTYGYSYGSSYSSWPYRSSSIYSSPLRSHRHR